MSKKAMKLALEALETTSSYATAGWVEKAHREAITSLHQAIAEAEKQEHGEPVAWLAYRYEGGHKNLEVADEREFTAFKVYTTPQQRTWVGLDPEEIRKTNHHMVDGAYHYSFKQGAEWAEAQLKEKNNA